MFYCEECRKKKNWSISVSKSSGPCEICHKHTMCYDANSKCLSLPAEPQHGREPDKYAHKPGCNPKPWENDCECGVLQKARKPDKVKSLAQYLAKDIAYNVYGHDVHRWGTTKWQKLLEQTLDAYESTEQVKIRIEPI